MAEKERRVFAGYYKRYDGKHIFVVTTAKDYESQEDTVIFYYVAYSGKNDYVIMPLKDFNVKVKLGGKTVRLFTRHLLCKERQRYIGISKEDYAIMVSDPALSGRLLRYSLQNALSLWVFFS